MAIHVIGYDIHPSKGETYAALEDAIENLGGWWHCLDFDLAGQQQFQCSSNPRRAASAYQNRRSAFGASIRPDQSGCCVVRIHRRLPRLASKEPLARAAEHQTGKRRVVVIARERNGKTLSFVFKAEGESLETLGKRIEVGSIVHADEAAHWDTLHSRYLPSASITKRLTVTAKPAPIRPSRFLSPTLRRDRHASPCRWAIFAFLRRRNGLA